MRYRARSFLLRAGIWIDFGLECFKFAAEGAEMKHIVKKYLAKNYVLINPVWKLYFKMFRGLRDHQPLRLEEDENIFQKIYLGNYWKDEESRSGPGSSLRYTAPIRRTLPVLFARYGMTSILDAPCGDFNWMAHVDLGDRTYIGGDIVPEMVSALNERFANPKRSFVVIDITSTSVPGADVWMCRDVLFHIKFDAALATLRNFANSNIKYLLTTNYDLVDENSDLEKTGGYRNINLLLPPFNLPKPIDQIDDFVFPWRPRYLGLWTREQVARAVAQTN